MTGVQTCALPILAYGIPGETVDGNDVFAVHEAASKAAERARRGEGPTLLECLTYRWQGHNVGDPGKYRPDDEVAEWKSRDPLRLLEASGILSEQELSAIRADVEVEIADMCAFAAESEYPPLSELGTDVFVDERSSALQKSFHDQCLLAKVDTAKTVRVLRRRSRRE